MSTGYEIISRTQSKLFDLTDKTVLAAVGCNSDITTLRRMLDARLTQYQHSEGKPMSSSAAAQLLSVTLYVTFVPLLPAGESAGYALYICRTRDPGNGAVGAV
jgi:20S proteasome alpha/beta subunit